jgi:polysaccharide export outer membrane protein
MLKRDEVFAMRAEWLGGATRMVVWRWLQACVAVALAAGCASPPPQEAISAPPASLQQEYRIGVDDKVQVSVWRNPELSVTAPVRPDGMISVPIIGDVQAGGRTPAEVAETIKERLSTYIREPNVAVILTELHSHEFLTRIRVTGAVRTPRSMPHRQGMTVLDAILESGGLNEFAAPNRTRLYRKVEGNVQVYNIELEDILTKGRLESNVTLKPGDVITVPERLF